LRNPTGFTKPARRSIVPEPRLEQGAKFNSSRSTATNDRAEASFADAAWLEMPAATRRTTRDATNLLTSAPDEAAIIIAYALADPRDLLSLAASCRRFFIKCIVAPSPSLETSCARTVSVLSH